MPLACGVLRCEQAPLRYLGASLLRGPSANSSRMRAYQRRIAVWFVVSVSFSKAIALLRRTCARLLARAARCVGLASFTFVLYPSCSGTHSPSLSHYRACNLWLKTTQRMCAAQWVRGQAREGIVDAHSLPDVPAGTYRLKIGMYDAVTQVRFAVSAADGAVLPDGILPLGSIARP